MSCRRRTITAATLACRHRWFAGTWNARANRDSFGKFGERVAKNSTPAWHAIIGVGLILVGIVTLLRVIFPGSN